MVSADRSPENDFFVLRSTWLEDHLFLLGSLWNIINNLYRLGMDSILFVSVEAHKIIISLTSAFQIEASANTRVQVEDALSEKNTRSMMNEIKQHNLRRHHSCLALCRGDLAHSLIKTLVLLMFASANFRSVESRALLNAQQTPIHRLTSPNTFYFLEFPVDDTTESDGFAPMCGDGSPYSFLFRRGTDQHLSKLLVEFEGGPACWSTVEGDFGCSCEATSAPTNRLQTPWHEYLQTDELYVTQSGNFPPLNSCTGVASGFVQMGMGALLGTSSVDAPIPLRRNKSNETRSQWWELLGDEVTDWSYILLPHCTLDWHLGHQTKAQPTSCEKDEAVIHRGGANAQAVLEWVNTQFQPLGGLEALVATPGGRIGGCQGGAVETSSIAPSIFAAGAEMRGDGSTSKLIITEGSSLWNEFLPGQDALVKRWSASTLTPPYTGTTLLDTLEDIMMNNAAQYAWFASTMGAKTNKEMMWLTKLKQEFPDSFHLYTPITGDDGVTEETQSSCPLFSFSDSNHPSDGLSDFLTGLSHRMSWSSPSSTSDADRRFMTNGSDTGDTRLTFLSVVVILLGLLALAWLLYFLLKRHREKRQESPPPSPNDFWFIALTFYPGAFLLVSILIPISLSFAAYAKSGYQVNMNLDFDSYLDIDTEMENIAQSYALAQEYQQDSLDVEDQNCAALNGNVFNMFNGKRKLLEAELNEMLENELHPFSMKIEDAGFPSFAAESPHKLALSSTDRELQYELYRSSGQVIQILYQNRNGGSVFEPQVLESIRRFEQSILDFPGFSDYCFSLGSRCVPFDSIVPLFFPRGQLVSNIDSVLRSFFGDPTAIWKVDQHFAPDNLASNITRTFVWLRDMGGDQSAANGFLERLYREMFWKTDQARPAVYPDMIFTWGNAHMGDLEAADAVNHDALWAGGSFLFIGLMILFKVRNVFVFVCSMLGLGLSFVTAYYWCLVHFDIPEITLLHVSSLFVMMGIGADDIFLMVDSFEHTKICEETRYAIDSTDGEEDDIVEKERYVNGIQIIRERMKSAYSTAGSMMLVSSMTTSICFFSNAFGVVVVIQQFGIYMGMVVLINFVHVMTILPSAILVNQFYVLPRWKKLVSYCRDSSRKGADHSDEVSSSAEGNNESISQDESSPSEDPMDTESGVAVISRSHCDQQPIDILDDTSKMNRMDRWFVEKYSPFVTRRRLAIVFLISTMAIVLGIVGITTFQVSDGTIVLFSDQFNLGRLNTLKQAYFNADLSKTIDTGRPDGSGGSGPDGSGSTDGSGTVGGVPSVPISEPGQSPAQAPANRPQQEPSSPSPIDLPSPVDLPSPTDPGNGGSPSTGNTAQDTSPGGSTNNGGGQTADSFCSEGCHNGGLCTFAGVCYCDDGWGGDFCTVPVCPTVNGDLCSAKGSCMTHSNGVMGSTECRCGNAFSGSGCERLKAEDEPLTRREAIVVRLIWGVETRRSRSNLWVIREALSQETETASSTSPNVNYPMAGYQKGAPIDSSFDLSEPHTQKWLLTVAKMARNDTNLNVQSDALTWIEILEESAIETGVGFPLPKDIFVGYIQLMKERSPDFAALVAREIGTRSPGLAGDFLYASMTLRADVVDSKESLSETTLRGWRNFVDSVNQLAPSEVPPCVAQSRTFLNAHRSEETISSTGISWLVANGLCLAIILLFTQNIMLSFMVMVVIFLIFLCLAGLLFGIFALPFGPIEALGVSIFIGLSANYSLHIVHAYHRSTSGDRVRKVKEAIFVTGSPITASGLSTIGGCLFLFACRTYVFVELGILICSITFMALLFSMTFLPAWLTMMGPIPIGIGKLSDDDDDISPRESGHRVHQCDFKALCCRRRLRSAMHQRSKDTTDDAATSGRSRTFEGVLPDEEACDDHSSDASLDAAAAAAAVVTVASSFKKKQTRNDSHRSSKDWSSLLRQQSQSSALAATSKKKQEEGYSSDSDYSESSRDESLVQECLGRSSHHSNRCSRSFGGSSSSVLSARVLMDGSVESLDHNSMSSVG